MLVQHNKLLTKMNSFGLECHASHYCEIRGQAELAAALEFAKEQNLAIHVLGGGSNTLFHGDFNGLLLHVRTSGIEVQNSNEATTLLRVASGENWHQLVMGSLNQGFYGLENLALIPGTVGAAPIQNIGAYGVELSEFFVELDIYHLEQRKRLLLTKDECEFGYRDSIFKHALKNKVIILSVTLELSNHPRPNLKYTALKQEMIAQFGEASLPDITAHQVAATVCYIRQRKLPDPSILGNAGSFFKNPTMSTERYQALCVKFPDLPCFPASNPSQVKIPAGWLLDKDGWKGKRVGGAAVHDEQALVIVNQNAATADDIIELAQQMRDSVKDKYGIELETEVQIV